MKFQVIFGLFLSISFAFAKELEFLENDKPSRTQHIRKRVTTEVKANEVEFLDIKPKANATNAAIPETKSGEVQFLDIAKPKANTTAASSASSKTVEFVELNTDKKPEQATPTKVADKTVDFLEIGGDKKKSEEKKTEPAAKGAVEFLTVEQTNSTKPATPAPITPKAAVEFLEIDDKKKVNETVAATKTTTTPTATDGIAFLDVIPTNKTTVATKIEKKEEATAAGGVTFLDLGGEKKTTETKSETNQETKKEAPEADKSNQVAFLDVSKPTAPTVATAENIRKSKAAAGADEGIDLPINMKEEKKATTQVVLITGITSVLGAHIARELLAAENFRIVGLLQHDNEATDQLSGVIKDITLTVGDISDGMLMSDIIRDVNPDLIFHLLGEFTSSQHPLVSVKTNVQGTLNILEALKRHDLLKTRIFYAGSSKEYGRSVEGLNGEPIPETTKLDPATSDAISKVAAESLLREYHVNYGIPVIISRIFTHFGKSVILSDIQEYCREIALIEAKVHKVLKYSPHNTIRDILHSRDVALASIQLALKGVPGEVYNIGRGQGVSTKDILKELLTTTTATDYTTAKANLRVHSYEKSVVADITKLVQLTGWKPSVSVSETLLEELNHWRYVVKHSYGHGL